MRKRLVAWKVNCFREINMYRLHQLHRTQLTAFSIVSFDLHFYSFKIFLCFWLASILIFITCWCWPNLENQSLRRQGMMYHVARHFWRTRGRRWPNCFPPTFLDPLRLPVWRHIVTGKSLGSLVQISKGYHSY